MRMLIFLFYSTNLMAIEWNNDSFKESLNNWNKKVNDYIENPNKITKDFNEKYTKSIKDVSNPLLDKYKNDIEFFNQKIKKKKDTGTYFYNRFISYSKIKESDDLYYNFIHDYEYSFPIFWKEVVEEIPVVVPLKLEITNRIDSMRIYPYLLMPYINNIKYQIKTLNH